MTPPFDAFRLPGLPAAPDLQRQHGPLPIRYPRPTPATIAGVLARLRAARPGLVGRPVLEVVDAVDAAAARLADANDPLRREAVRLIPLATGYSPAMATLVLDRMAADWRRGPLRRLLDAELGDPAVLDRFVPTGPGRHTRAYGAGVAFHVLAGNVPGVGVTSLVRSLLAKTPALAKLAAGEPVLPVLFVDALASVDPGLAGALGVTYWPGGTDEAEAAAVAGADLIVVYGGGAAVASVRARAGDRQVVVHGPRFSAGLVGKVALDGDLSRLASDVARAVATFDQQGCVSPYALWIEDPDGTRTDPFVDALAAAMARVEEDLPRGRLTPEEASLIHQERGAAEMRGHAGQGGRVVAGTGTTWTIAVEPDPQLRPSSLNRFLRLHPVPSLDQALPALAAHHAHLQSVAIADAPERRQSLAHRLALAGAARITTFERLPWPPPEWHHDGGAPLRELLRWVDLED